MLLVFPCLKPTQRRMAKQRWSAALLNSIGVVVEADMGAAVPGALLVANHVSWIDIFVINAVLPAAFVAKAEVRRWPLIGWLAARNDTIFLRRGSRGHAREINAEIAAVLAAEQQVAVFPEGTTTDGRSLLHFHAALIQPALLAARPVVPLALSYWHPDGQRSLAPRYDGEISLFSCLCAIIAQPQTVARLVVGKPLGQSGEDRRQVAALARQAIAAGARLPLPNN